VIGEKAHLARWYNLFFEVAAVSKQFALARCGWFQFLQFQKEYEKNELTAAF
jgi:hypothetical protein